VARTPLNAHLDAPNFAETYQVRWRLKALLIERGIVNNRKKPNLTECARRTGVQWNTLERASNNRVKGVDFDTLLRLSVGLRCSINELFEIVERDEKDAPQS
jgi:DNA-binding Xre family transcriptional regulator